MGLPDDSIIRDYLDEAREAVDPLILDALADQGNLKEPAQHIIRAGGKRLRPALTIAAARLGTEPPGTKHVAAAIEALHAMTLVHDDIMDNDRTRRGEPTVHEVWNDDTAILAGDVLYGQSFRLANDAMERAEKNDTAVCRLLSEALGKICQGQQQDLHFEQRQHVQHSDYVDMIAYKTAMLFQTAVKAGGLFGDLNPEAVSKLDSYGRSLGLAFQVRDDVLDLIGGEDMIGKPVGSDLRQGKWTLPVIEAYQNGTDDLIERMESVFNNPEATDAQLQDATDAMDADGVFERTDELVDQYVRDGGRALEDLPDNEARQFLSELLDFASERSY